ncbi:DUF4157 domain-containing protein [Kribbella sp. NPDC049174]|uniref:eCIS core domain-containing protein n=1 Tax=Kribbella sp. NPDC049174 TaxID=3364112 RepID=UPI003719D170
MSRLLTRVVDPRLREAIGTVGAGERSIARLEPMARAEMEGLLGHDLSGVRIHTGAAAAASARRLDARAYTIGDDIVLGDTVPSLDSQTGRQALGHELVHVVQQRLGGATGAEADSVYEQDAEQAAVALAEGHRPAPVVRGTTVGVARQPMDPRHARGYAGEQGMGFIHYRREDGWIFFEGPSGARGHGVTQPGFDGVAYNVRTGETHLVDNKSLAATGNVRSATAIDPSRNLGKNLDALIQRVEAAKDVPGRIGLLGRLRALKASLAGGQPLPDDVKLVVTSVGGRTTDVSRRLKDVGVQHLPAPPPRPAPSPAPSPSPALTPPVETPTVAPAPKPAVVQAPATPAVTPTVRPTSAWKAGLKAGGKTVVAVLIFAGLEYLVHQRLEKDLEESIDKAREGAMPWAQRVKRQDPSKPVYLRVTVRSAAYSRYWPLTGWMPEPPQLRMTQIAMVRAEIDPPIVKVEDHPLDILRPGTSTEVTYTELMVP